MFRGTIIFFVVLSVLPSCKQSGGNFEGGSERKSSQSQPAGPQALPPPTEPQSVPPQAVTRGSFSAWTEPARPAPNQPYFIHVRVKLPSNAVSYNYQDLSGSVVGTDDYRRGVGRDSLGPYGGTKLFPKINSLKPTQAQSDKFEFRSGAAEIRLYVPGATRLVRDVIQLRSDLLNEVQTIELVFGS
jgi:hypothetical protein